MNDSRTTNEYSGSDCIQVDDSIKTSENTPKNKVLPLIDQLMNQAGYTKYQWMIIFFTNLVLFVDGMHMTMFNSMFLPLQDYFNLSQYQVSIVSSTMFLSVAVGSLLSNIDIISRNRKNTIIASMFAIFIFNFTLSLSNTLWLFIVLRGGIGVCIGLLMPLSNNLLCEFLPMKLRSFFLVVTGVSFGLGAMFLSLVMYQVMPNLEKEEVSKVMLYTSVPVGIFSFIFLFFLKESPRHLLLNNKQEQGFEMLSNMTYTMLTQEQKATIMRQIRKSNNTPKGHLRSIFNREYVLITIILISIWMTNAFIAYGGSFSLTLTIKRLESLNIINNKQTSIDENQNISHNSSIIRKQILIYLIGLPGNFIAGAMTETKTFGRKMTIFTGFFLITLFTVIGTFNQSNFPIFTGLAGMFLSLSFSVAGSYSCEVYNTKVRNTALGILYCCMRISGFASQYLAVLLFNLHYLGPYYAIATMSFVAMVLTYMLPYDTYGKPLDADDNASDETDIDSKLSF